MGGDPAARKAEKKAVPTYAELADQHLAFAKTYQKRPGNTDAVLRVHILPRWGKKRLDEITTPEVAKWLAQLRETGLAPATVEKVRITFNRSFELALKWQTKGVQHNPVRGIPRPKFNNARDRFLTSDEAAALLKACEASINKQLKNIVGLLLLTGARKRELLDAEWQHISLDRRVWYIPASQSKTGKARHVPLSQSALDLIATLPRYEKCPWLLPNPATKKPYTDIKHPWEKAREAAGLPGLHIHDLRHSAASFMINAGIDLFAVGRILGHADHQSTMRYSHLANDTLMQAVEAGAAKMNVNWAGAGGQANGL
jgi:integrase